MRVTIPTIVLLLLIGCQSGPAGSAGNGPADGHHTTPQPPPIGKPIAYVNGQNVRVTDLRDDLLERAGGVVLRDFVLDRALRERVQRRGITLGQTELLSEKQRLLRLLSDRPNEASRLLNQLRERRGLGEQRFEKFLWRNAALRALTADRVELAEADIRRAFALRYGERYRVRLIVVGNVAEAARVRRELDAGKPFFQAALEHSTDQSAARGGLLAPIHPDDPTYPAAIRQVLTRLQPGQVSRPIALDRGVALIQLKEIVPARPVAFEAVRSELERDVRLEAQEQLMRQLALTLVSEADVLILNPALQDAWDRARRAAPVGP